MLVLSIAAMVLMTRKYVENWLLWVLIDVISVVIYAVQGLCHVAGVCPADSHCGDGLLQLDSERKT